jgi:hypothetical protein
MQAWARLTPAVLPEGVLRLVRPGFWRQALNQSRGRHAGLQ